MLKYYPSIQLAISDNAKFPHDEEGFEKEFEAEDTIVDENNSDNEILQLREWETYYLQFYGGIKPEVLQDYPELKIFNGDYEGTFIQEEMGGVYKINFQNYVGLSKIGPVKLEIINRKINKKQYQSLLAYITRQYIDLVYQFSKTSNNDKSHTGYNQKRTEVGSNLNYIDFLFLKLKLLGVDTKQPTIKEILNLIINEPHYKIECDFIHTPTELVRIVDPTRLIEAVTTGNNLQRLSPNHSLGNTPLAIKLQDLSTDNTAYFPIQIREEKKYHSFDTPENRFVKYFLQQLLQLLDQLKKQFFCMEKTYFNPELERELNLLINPIKNCLEDQIWREVLPMRYIPTNSQVLQRKEGYRQLLSLYSLMQLASEYDFNNFDFKKLVESKDTNILYEYWCFFMVKDILDEQLGKAVRYKQLVYENPEQTNQEISEGTYLHYENGIQLGFNITFNSRHDSYSQEYRPDIVLKYNNRHLIFDAKHKLKGWDDDFSKPKKEDIDKIHTYRDAIINTVGAFILYPGESNVLYRYHGSEYEYEGVGGITLIPDSSKNGLAVDNNKLTTLIHEFIEI